MVLIGILTSNYKNFLAIFPNIGNLRPHLTQAIT